ncbi:MAG: translation factor GTPase family protein [Lachnospiraceae bacterium]|nr:translation factor GTPase family protein [Lachnospiraceae bacterium]
MGNICVGLLAHVDAGKTTLSESLLYLCGAIRKAGRVDNKDVFLDTFELERQRGITIFSKQAVFRMGDLDVSLMDTPGHVDFSAEMERTLQVLDYAVLVVSGADGVQGHTQTLWKLLRQYNIPVFLFINKMDQAGTDKEKLLKDVKHRLNENCMDFSGDMESEDFLENLAVCDETVLEHYLETGQVSEDEIAQMIQERKVFPCYFGSALKMTGVDTFIRGLERYIRIPEYPAEFGAKVYKIVRDDQGSRLTYLKVTGGSLKVKSFLLEEEKVNQIRIYSGAKYELTDEAAAGMVCAVTGPVSTYAGQGIGCEKASDMPILEPVLNYRIELPPDADVHGMLQKLLLLEEEEPQLHIVWNEKLNEIHAQLMGEVQTEVLRSLIFERFGVLVRFGTGNIMYKETIREPVEGVGHFEPLRHYAEVHLLLEPGEQGSGMHFTTNCSEDVLDRNWQRLILTHLEEKEHLGVLTGSPITDMKITLIGGKAHLKHTEGGDFRQSTYRAVRQGLKMAESILLEPYYEFRLELPPEMIGRAMSDVQKMHGRFEPPAQDEEMSILTGYAPVSAMRDYQREVISYSKGRGRLFCSLKGYEPCHNQDEIVESIGYDSERDLDNPTGSVFCAHGAGFVVPWNQVRDYMHVDCGFEMEEKAAPVDIVPDQPYEQRQKEYWASEKELEDIFERTYGPVKRKIGGESRRVSSAGSYGTGRAESSDWENRVPKQSMPEKPYQPKTKVKLEEYLLVDGYNIIFAWEDLKALAENNIDSARDKLMDILSEYGGIRNCNLILVFDAYKVEGGIGSVQKYHGIYVVYTKEAETADQYIEKTAHEIGRKYDVTVATSDGLEQVIIRGQGCKLLSARELRDEIDWAKEQVRQEIRTKRESGKNYLMNHASDEIASHVEAVRMGRKSWDDKV